MPLNSTANYRDTTTAKFHIVLACYTCYSVSLNFYLKLSLYFKTFIMMCA